MKHDSAKATVEMLVGGAGRASQLTVCSGGKISVHALPSFGPVVVGRAADAPICIDDDSVSREHARVWCGEELAVEDLGSRNGTRVMGAPVPASQRVALRVGAIVEFGKTSAFVSRGVAAPPSKVDAAGVAEGELALGSPQMHEMESTLRIAAPSPFPILILGETGVGKDVVAEWIHRQSARADKKLVRLNCAALAESLLESELFGHEKGAFTGAIGAKEGLFEAADGGTIFLDEVGEMPLSTQAKLLRVLENGEVLRVGSVRAKRVDVRFIAATNRDLVARCKSGTFRSDLYFRLSGIVVTVPPLRERLSDIEPLARLFAASAARRLGRATAPDLTDAARAKLQRHSWPGNVRELRHVIDRGTLLAAGGMIDASHVSLEAGAALAEPPPTPPQVPLERGSSVTSAAPSAGATSGAAGLNDEVRDLESRRVREALAACAGNQSRAAKMLGISRRALLRRIEDFGIERPRKRAAD